MWSSDKGRRQPNLAEKSQKRRGPKAAGLLFVTSLRDQEGLPVCAACHSCSPSTWAAPSGSISTCNVIGWQQTGQSSTYS